MLRLDPEAVDALKRIAGQESARGKGRALTAQDVARRAIELFLRGHPRAVAGTASGGGPPAPMPRPVDASAAAPDAGPSKQQNRSSSPGRITRPMLQWPGGKWRLAPWIASFFPAHDAYVEPFGGAASVLLRKPPCRREVYNELDAELLNLVRVLRSCPLAAELLRLLRYTPFSRVEFNEAYGPVSANPVERARRLLIRSFMGHGPSGGPMLKRTGFRSNAAAAGTSPAQDWSRHPAELAKIAARLRGVEVESMDALALLPRHDGPRTLFYVDPPYLPGTRDKGADYRHELTAGRHAELLAALRKLRGMVVLSGYPSELYGRLLAGWERHEKKAHADGGRGRTECVWLNRACVRGLAAQGALAA